MIYGITGNTDKDRLWAPVAHTVDWLVAQDKPFVLHRAVAEGLRQRRLTDEAICTAHATADIAAAADILLSFGGDGTLLNSAHAVGTQGTPILGVNIGRLGFLADIEVGHVQTTLERLEAGEYRIEERLVLEASVEDGPPLAARFAINEFVLSRSGENGMILIEVLVDGVLLNTYWADGLIFATPTGSTAYSLSVGGPILVPRCGAIALTPIAPHTLTARPIVLPDDVEITVRVLNPELPSVFTADGRSTRFEEQPATLTIRKARHSVHLVKLPEQHFFQNLRNKLMWGARKTSDR